MRRLIGILTCAVVFGAMPAHSYADSTDETLKRFFPDRDVSKAVLKFVDTTNGYYAVGDSLEVTENGGVRTTNAHIVQVVSRPNEPLRFSEYRGDRALLLFAKPVRQPSDMAGNRIESVILEK